MLPKPLLETIINAALAAFKEIPFAGGVIEFHDRQAYAEALREIFARFETVEARLQVLENLALQPAQELYDFTLQFLAPQPLETTQFIAEIIQQLPQSIARSTTTTRHWGAIKNLDSKDFYLELIPAARPENWAGQALPHRPRWRLERELGRGGFGAVWLAVHAHLPEREAIKFCHRESDVQFLRREFNTLKLLQTELSSHPHIVKLKDLNLEQAPYWLAFDYVDGGTLLTVMRLRHLAWAEVLDLMQQISTGVAAAHALNIVHRDLKPANILLTGDGVAKVADFGLGKITVGTTTTRLTAGTFGYASPEQLAGEKAEPSDDVYALAVLFWQMATHTLQPLAYLHDSLNKSRLPALAKTLILDCLEQPRGQRPKDAAAFLARLQQLPSVLAEKVDLDGMRQEAEQARRQAQTKQDQEFAKNLAQQKQQAEAQAQAQAARLENFAAAPKATPAASGKLAEDWQRFQELEKEIINTKQQFAQEWQAEIAKIGTARQQALAQLGEFRFPPRDEEFEYEAEYQARQQREQLAYDKKKQAIARLWMETQQSAEERIKAAENAAITALQTEWQRLGQQDYPVVFQQLHDFRYQLDSQQLAFRAEKTELLPLEILAIDGQAEVPRDAARLYREQPQAFAVTAHLGFAETIGLTVKSATLEIAAVGRFPATLTVARQPDKDAIAQQAFEKARAEDTEAAYQQVINAHSGSSWAHQAEARRQVLAAQRRQQQQQEAERQAEERRQVLAEQQRQQQQQEAERQAAAAAKSLASFLRVMLLVVGSALLWLLLVGFWLPIDWLKGIVGAIAFAILGAIGGAILGALKGAIEGALKGAIRGANAGAIEGASMGAIGGAIYGAIGGAIWGAEIVGTAVALWFVFVLPWCWLWLVGRFDLAFFAKAERIFWSYALYVLGAAWLLPWAFAYRGYQLSYEAGVGFVIFLIGLGIFGLRLNVRYNNLLSMKK